ncbi:Sec-independent protein translocase protein TatB [Thalassotalea montiporae]
MFDIGFWELMLIAVIGLLVLGPERLPVAIRTVRDWINGVRQFSQSVKTELKEELRINELHENLKKAEQSDFKNMSPQVAESLKSLQEAAEMVNRPFQQTEATQPPPDSQQNTNQEALTNASSTTQETSTPNDKQSG